MKESRHYMVTIERFPDYPVEGARGNIFTFGVYAETVHEAILLADGMMMERAGEDMLHGKVVTVENR